MDYVCEGGSGPRFSRETDHRVRKMYIVPAYEYVHRWSLMARRANCLIPSRVCGYVVGPVYL